MLRWDDLVNRPLLVCHYAPCSLRVSSDLVNDPLHRCPGCVSRQSYSVIANLGAYPESAMKAAGIANGLSRRTHQPTP